MEGKERVGGKEVGGERREWEGREGEEREEGGRGYYEWRSRTHREECLLVPLPQGNRAMEHVLTLPHPTPPRPPLPTNLHVEFPGHILQKDNEVVLRCSNLLISHFLLICKGRSLRRKWEGQVRSEGGAGGGEGGAGEVWEGQVGGGRDRWGGRGR